MIEPNESVSDALAVLLGGEGWAVKSLDRCHDLAETIRQESVVAVISESTLPECTPQEILEQCQENGVPVIFTGHDLSLQGAVDLIRMGAMDFLDKPFPQNRLIDLLNGLIKGQNS